MRNNGSRPVRRGAIHAFGAPRWIRLSRTDHSPCEGTFAPQALLYTDLNAAALQIVSWCVLRWQLDVTYHEVRVPLGVDGTLDNVVVSEHQTPE